MSANGRKRAQNKECLFSSDRCFAGAAAAAAAGNHNAFPWNKTLYASRRTAVSRRDSLGLRRRMDTVLSPWVQQQMHVLSRAEEDKTTSQ